MEMEMEMDMDMHHVVALALIEMHSTDEMYSTMSCRGRGANDPMIS